MESAQWEEQTLEELINEVCRRPEMYSGDQEFHSAALFIYGFAAGRGPKEFGELKRFTQWIAYRCWPKLRLPQNYGWDWYVEQLHPSDEDAFLSLPQLYKQFLAQDDEQGKAKT